MSSSVSRSSSKNRRLLDSAKFRSYVRPTFKTISPEAQMDRIAGMLDDTMTKFMRRYIDITVELEAMKQEFFGDLSLIKEHIMLAKKMMRLKVNAEDEEYGQTHAQAHAQEQSQFEQLNQLNVNKYLNHTSKNPAFKKLPANVKPLYLLVLSPEVEFKDKLKLIFSNKYLFSLKRTLIRQVLPQFRKEILQIKELSFVGVSKDDKKMLLEINGYPAQTTISGLNFLTDKREKELQMTTELNAKLVSMVSACLGETCSYKTVAKGYDFLFAKYGVGSIKELFFGVIFDKIYRTCVDEDAEFLGDILTAITPHREVIAEHLLKYYGRSFAKVAEALDEVDNYLSCLLRMDDDMKIRLKNLMYVKDLEKYEEWLRNKVK